MNVNQYFSLLKMLPYSLETKQPNVGIFSPTTEFSMTDLLSILDIMKLTAVGKVFQETQRDYVGCGRDSLCN